MAGRIAAPKKAIVDEDEAKAAAPKPAKITATPILTVNTCLLYTSPSPRDVEESRMPSSA